MLRYLRTPAAVLTHPPTDDPRFVDWYDYRQRIDGASPDAAAAEALERAGDDGAVWLVRASGYLGFEQHCESLAAALARSRSAETVLQPRPVYEPMHLSRFPAPAG